MQHRINNLTGYLLKATDGNLGKVHEFYFDDETWTIRYMVVDTRHWLFGRKALVSLAALGRPDETAKTFSVNLTSDQVRHSPDIDTEKPVNRQHEADLHAYYQWPIYWESGIGSDLGIASYPFLASEDPLKSVAYGYEHQGNPHLRSTHQVTGYHIHTLDGEIGSLSDFIIDDANWSIQFLVVSIKDNAFTREVLLSPRWIKRVQWDDSNIYLNSTWEAIKQSPGYDTSKIIPETADIKG